MLNYSWSKDYSVGDPVFDDHHKNLLHLFEKASNLLAGDGEKEETLSLLRELKSYTIFHFTAEEKKMDASNYPDTDAHKLAHQAFVDKIGELYTTVETNHGAVNEELFLFLNSWLIDHIQVMDKAYVGKL